MKQCLLYFLLLIPLLTAAQDVFYQKDKQAVPKRTYTILLKDGTQLRGELIRQDSVEAIIRTANLGEVRLKSDQIVRLEQVGAQAGEVGYPNGFPQTMRFTPTAFTAEKGRLYYRNYLVYVNQFEYGINENWSVGTTFFIFAPSNLFSFNTKVSFPVSNRVRLGVNAQYAAIRFNDFPLNNTYADIGYIQGIVTVGDRQNNTTFGLGGTLANGDVSKNLIGTVGLVRKVSPRLTFISENFVLLGSGVDRFAGVISAGIRFDRRRHAFDLAVYLPLVFGRNNATTFTLIPFGSYHLRLGK